MKTTIAFTLLSLLALGVSPLAMAAPAAISAAAKDGMNIAAIVNDEAISSYDVNNRMKFIIITARLSNTPDVIERIRPQVIRTLIDEKLELQEAAKNDIHVSDDEIAHSMAAIEQERGLPAGTIDHILKDNNLPRATFAQQVKAQMAWHKLLLKKIKPQVKISDEEIRLGSKRAMLPPPPKASSVPQEWQIAVIALPVDKASREMQMRQLGEKLVKEIRGGASFEEVSRQFSSSAASNGGKTESFWVRSGQLDPSVAQALAAAKEGMVTDPVRTAAGYTIVKLYKTRSIGKAPEPEAADDNKDMQVSLKEILLKLKPGAKEKEASVLLQIGEDVAKHPGSCKEKGVAGIDNLDDYNIEVNFQTALLSELPPAIRIIADNLKVGDISTPFASDAGIRLFMLCGKKDPANAPPDKERVYGMLLQEKMLLEAQKYLRNLRRDSFIEVRKE